MNHTATTSFRAAALRRSVVLAWVVLPVVVAQAVRVGEFTHTRFLWPMAGLLAVLTLATTIDWEPMLERSVGDHLAWAWSVGLTVGLASIAAVPGMFGVAAPLFTGVVTLTGVVLPPLRHLLVSLSAAFLLSWTALGSGNVSDPSDLAVPLLTLGVVAVASSLLGLELQRISQLHSRHVAEMEESRGAFERLYAVSATLARVESLRDGLPHLVGTICRYLDAQVGAVFLYQEFRHDLTLLNPIWVNGHVLEADELTSPVSRGGILVQVFRSGRALHVDRISDNRTRFGPLGELGIDEALVAPLRVEGLSLGTIVVGDPRSGSFRPEQLDELVSLSAAAALVVSQLHRYELAAEMGRRMQEVAKMKSDFVSIVSHELRTPLTSIIAALDTLMRPDLPDRAARELVESSRRQADRLERLIEDLLIVSRIDRQALPTSIEPVKVLPFLTELTGTLGTIDNSAVSVEPSDLMVWADPDHLGRVFINLLDNAAKYAAGSPVEIRARRVRRHAEISVVDHGPGIPEDHRDRIFERFTQLERPDTRSRGGTGLGLSIVKDLVEAMNGRVEVSDTPGGGATFTVRLPCA